MSTNEDIRFLVGLARDKSVEGRKRLVAVVNDIFFSDHSTLTDYERALITDILHRLIGDLIEPVRRALRDLTAGIVRGHLRRPLKSLEFFAQLPRDA